jgi:hypothetical protein
MSKLKGASYDLQHLPVFANYFNILGLTGGKGLQVNPRWHPLRKKNPGTPSLNKYQLFELILEPC